jgi:hypothetical protein
MATRKTIVKTCPSCGAFFNAEAYEVINATLDTALRDEVIWGRIFDFTCPSCTHHFRSPYSMAYKEMEKEYIIFLELDEDARDEDERISKSRITEDQIAETRELFPTYRIRVVHDMMDLIEKIHIFSAGLNDKIVTYLGHKIKDDITVKMKNAKPPIRVYKALFDSIKGKAGELNFGLLSSSPKPIFVTTPTRDYEYLLKKSPLRHQFEEAEGLYQIDEGWAAGIDKVLIA